MPALGRFVQNDGNLSLTAGAGWGAGAGVGLGDTACPCGKRRPVGVLLGLRSGGRPRMDNRWFCRRACLEQMLLQRARRDFPEGAVTASKVRHRVPMGLILQARGAVTAAELQEALRMQGGTGVRLGEILIGHFGVPEERITAAVAAQWGLPVLHLPTASPMSLASLAPLPLFQGSGSLPVERTANRLLLACADGPDMALALALERMHPVRVSFGVVSPRELEGWRSSAAAVETPVQRVECADRESMARAASEMLCKLQPVESKVVRLGSVWWLRAWLEDAARHTGTGEDTVDVLYTIAARAQDRERIELSSPDTGAAEPFQSQVGRAAPGGMVPSHTVEVAPVQAGAQDAVAGLVVQAVPEAEVLVALADAAPDAGLEAMGVAPVSHEPAAHPLLESAREAIELSPEAAASQAFVMPRASASVVSELSFAAWHEDGRDTAPHSEMEPRIELGNAA